MVNKEVSEICAKYVSRREDRDKVIECVERCLRKGYDYHKMKERVSDAVDDEHRAEKLVAALSSAFSEFKKKSRFTESKGERRAKREDYKEEVKEEPTDAPATKRAREGDDVPFDIEIEKARIRKLAEEAIERKKMEEEAKRSRVVTEDQLKAKEMLYKAQQQIEEVKARLNIKGPELSTATKNKIAAQNAGKDRANVLDQREAMMYMNFRMSKKSRMEELKAKLAKSNGALPAVSATTSTTAVPQAKVAAAREEPIPDEFLAREREPNEEQNKIVEFLDPRLKLKSAGRQRRGLIFHEKGEFEQMANKQRAKAKLEKLQEEISKAAKQTGISSAVKLAMVTPAGSSSFEVPEIEWWDQVVLDDLTYTAIADEKDPNRYNGTISELIEHPIKLQPPNESVQTQYLKVYLTKKERKKIRRMNRKETQKELTEKIRLGLEKAPEPKVKLSNLMRVLGNDAIQDPTKVEAHVRKQVAERLRKHQKENAERKLTAEQKSAKKTKKLSEDTSLGVAVTVYRLKSLGHPAKKFKVEMNAKQLQLTGLILLHKDINIVIVEGGPKQQKFFKNLMMNRIKWDEEIIGEKKAATDKEQPGERNECQLVWEGVVKKRAFRDFRVITATLHKQARELLEKHSVPHYWDLAYATTILLDGQSADL